MVVVLIPVQFLSGCEVLGTFLQQVKILSHEGRATLQVHLVRKHKKLHPPVLAWLCKLTCVLSILFKSHKIGLLEYHHQKRLYPNSSCFWPWARPHKCRRVMLSATPLSSQVSNLYQKVCDILYCKQLSFVQPSAIVVLSWLMQLFLLHNNSFFSCRGIKTMMGNVMGPNSFLETA